MNEKVDYKIKEIAEQACGRQIAKGDFTGLLENISRACGEARGT